MQQKAFADVVQHIHAKIVGKKLRTLVLAHIRKAEQSRYASNLREDDVGDAQPLTIDLQRNVFARDGGFLCKHSG